jgi:hypothetical protein
MDWTGAGWNQRWMFHFIGKIKQSGNRKWVLQFSFCSLNSLNGLRNPGKARMVFAFKILFWYLKIVLFYVLRSCVFMCTFCLNHLRLFMSVSPHVTPHLLLVSPHSSVSLAPEFLHDAMVPSSSWPAWLSPYLVKCFPISGVWTVKG